MLPTQELLAPLLTTRALGRSVETHLSLDSTNLRAKELARHDAPHGTLVVADSQTAGRGRMTRQWRSPAGKNLYVSLILRPSTPPQTVPQIAILAALALHRALTALLPDFAFGLKWPNDVWSPNGRKLSGILCEALLQQNSTAVIVGLGLNVNDTIADFPPELQATAGTLADLAGHPLPRPAVLAAFLNAFEPILEQWQQTASLAPFLDEWNAADILRGQAITVQSADETLSGTAAGLLPDGRLILLPPSGSPAFLHAGDTHILKKQPCAPSLSSPSSPSQA